MTTSPITTALGRVARAALVLAAATGVAGVAASTASAITFDALKSSITDSSGNPTRQAGSHPDVRLKYVVPSDARSDESLAIPEEMAHRLKVDMPPGLVGNPTAAETCPEAGLTAGANGQGALCPIGAQVGTALVLMGSTSFGISFPVYNVEPPAGSPAQFAFNVLGVVVKLTPSVRAGDYGISLDTGAISQGLTINGADVVLWGVPADPVHDAKRAAPTESGYAFPPSPSQSPRRPFLTLPTSCPGTADVTTASLDGWGSIGQFDTRTMSSDADGVPYVTTGCDQLPFAPTIDVRTTSRVADAPTGLEVDLKVPQNDDPDGLATAHVKDVSMVLPQGMSVSPSSAAGLGACRPADIGLGSDADHRCPRSSKLGTVEVDTPLLAKPLTGDVILAQPDDNPFGSLLAIYLVAQGDGVTVKLPGRIDANPVNGQLTATFSNNPQLPFSALRVRFAGGADAALATPPTCGRYVAHADITSWASPTPVGVDSAMAIDQGCEARGFAPKLTAGSAAPVAGKDSPFSLTLERPDRQQNLSQVTTELPAGLLARIRNVARCAEAQAASGACPAGSRVGSTQVLTGPGASPLPVKGDVYLTGPYGGAPYGLSIVVPTAGQAGPFDLGNVVVRAKILVDRGDAHVTVATDPLPTIIRGFPLRLQRVNVTIDRPGFTFNPSSCAASRVDVTSVSTEGTPSRSSSPFRLAGCGDLQQDQKLALRFTNKSQTRPGKHPGVKATLTSKGGGTNLEKVMVKLPLSVALDPENAKALCTPEQRIARACPAASIVGQARATSVLPEPLTGPVYFVKGTRKTETGRIAKTLPKLWIPLSAGGVTIDVDADSSVQQKRLVTTFSNLPDAPISSFELRIDSGKHGILEIPPSKQGGTCDRDRSIDMQLTGQNGKRLQRVTRVAVDGCKATRKQAKAKQAKKAKARPAKAGAAQAR